MSRLPEVRLGDQIAWTDIFGRNNVGVVTAMRLCDWDVRIGPQEPFYDCAGDPTRSRRDLRAWPIRQTVEVSTDAPEGMLW